MTRTRNAVLARVAAHRATVAPLSDLPVETQERIAEAVASPLPPERWLTFVGCSMPNRAWYEWHWARQIDPEGGRNGLSAETRAAVIRRDGYVCQICRDLVKTWDVHIDHIIPYSLGGPDSLSNLRVTHSRCNMRRGARL